STPSGGEIILSQLALMSADVNALPSWNFTPCCSVKVQVILSSESVHDFARSPMMLGYPCGSNTTRVLYTGEKGMVTRKVCSWCMSRLGGSPAKATRNTPPFRGFSSATPAGTAHRPTTSPPLTISPRSYLHPTAPPP